jgi:hypothetical protein
MANISKPVTYNLPDEYTKQTSDLGLTAEFTYKGPEYLWVFVDGETGALLPSQSFIATINPTRDEEQARVRAGLDEKAVLLRPNTNGTDLLLASILLGQDTGKATGYPQKEYKFPAGHARAGETYYERPDPQQPNHTYAVDEIMYDLANDSWVTPFPWFKPWMTEEFHKEARDSALEGNRVFYAEIKGNMTADQIAAADAWIAAMENLYTDFAGVEPFMIPFPENPLGELVEDYDYNVDPDNRLDDTKTDGAV